MNGLILGVADLRPTDLTGSDVCTSEAVTEVDADAEAEAMLSTGQFLGLRPRFFLPQIEFREQLGTEAVLEATISLTDAPPPEICAGRGREEEEDELGKGEEEEEWRAERGGREEEKDDRGKGEEEEEGRSG